MIVEAVPAGEEGTLAAAGAALTEAAEDGLADGGTGIHLLILEEVSKGSARVPPASPASGAEVSTASLGNVLETLWSAPETFRSVPETFRSAPETFRSVLEAFRSAPEVFRRLLEAFRSVPETFRNVPECLRSIP